MKQVRINLGSSVRFESLPDRFVTIKDSKIANGFYYVQEYCAKTVNGIKHFTATSWKPSVSESFEEAFIKAQMSGEKVYLLQQNEGILGSLIITRIRHDYMFTGNLILRKFKVISE